MAEGGLGQTGTPVANADPIRIVPVSPIDDIAAPAHGAPAPPPPQLTYRGGPLLSAVEVFTVFWGPAWATTPQTALAQSLNEFFDFVLTSALLDQLAEYSVPGAAIGHGRRTGSVTITTPQLGSSISDAAIQQALQQEISSNHAFPPPGPNTLYFIYMPPGVSVVQGGSRSCQAFCGYHNNVGGSTFYAVMPFPGCGGCTGGLTAIEALTSTSSHELCEAITDPIPGEGWYDDTHGEIGDICAWKTKVLGAYTVQLEWSNKANACV
ncbi:MAG TPA: hypothetical protein VMP89_12560 [Solirubrobacteraceae bacterium]|nr:hypothetical protein [Solirubrobacteraceae bacterium]